jgi:cytochrome c peroxidase
MIVSPVLLIGCLGGAPDDTASISEGDPKYFTEAEIVSLSRHWPLPDLPVNPTNAVVDDPYAAHFGQFLFFDDRLSNGNGVSCASCHDPEFGWGDSEQLSIGGIEVTGRHSPSIWNSAYLRWAFWDGRCDSLWCQATGPIEDSNEMGSNRMAVAHLIADDSNLREAYENIFGSMPDLTDETRFPENARPDDSSDHPLAIAWDSMQVEDQVTVNMIFTNITKSIAAFERLIVSRDAPFDEFAEAVITQNNLGGLEAISDSAARGLKLFIGDGLCHFCHDGPNFTNQEFANIGLGQRDWLKPGDHGRLTGVTTLLDNPFNGVGEYSDAPEEAAEQLSYLNTDDAELDGMFKVPTLRNITTHPPYMHGGHFETLEECVSHYIAPTEYPEFGHREDFLQPPLSSVTTLSLESDLPDLVAFLQTLTSDPLPASLTTQPESPTLE